MLFRSAATALLDGWLRAEGLHCSLEDVDGRQVLYASTEPTRTPAVLLNAHLDVVPGETDQFTPQVVGGWLHGRGSADCLGNAVICARALCRARGRASVGAIFSSDEEIGGGTTAAMVARGYGAKQLVLVVDGPAYAVAVAQKGIVTCVLTARGRSAHASTPWLGNNAIDRLVDGYVKVRTLFPEAKAGDEWHDTMAATVIAAGTAANRVPDEASLTLNLRYTEPGGDERWAARLRDASGLEVAIRMSCPVVSFDPATPALGRLAAAMQRHFRREIALVRMNGATDARHFARSEERRVGKECRSRW